MSLIFLSIMLENRSLIRPFYSTLLNVYKEKKYDSVSLDKKLNLE